MNKTLWMLLLLWALLTALTEMTRPQKPVLKTTAKKTTANDKPAGSLNWHTTNMEMNNSNKTWLSRYGVQVN